MKNLKDYTFLQLKNYEIKDLSLKSTALRANPLKDPYIRHNPVLVPKAAKPKAIAFVLAGFTGNGPYYFSQKAFSENFPTSIDRATTKGAPAIAYVFVDAWTALGGSQFINSSAVGKYEDYIVKELLPLSHKVFGKLPTAVMGGSSGGYGALHLASKFPTKFPYCLALAPDSAFEISLMPDLIKAISFLKDCSYEDFIKSLRKGELNDRRDFHSLLNAVAMAACYSPKGSSIQYPLDLETAELNEKSWKSILDKDPCVFVKARLQNIKKLKGLFLEVGNRDQFQLHFGARRIHKTLKKNKIPHFYNEFNGGHFDLHLRREAMIQWLQTNLA